MYDAVLIPEMESDARRGLGSRNPSQMARLRSTDRSSRTHSPVMHSPAPNAGVSSRTTRREQHNCSAVGHPAEVPPAGCRRLATRRMREIMNSVPGCLARSVAEHSESRGLIGSRPPPTPLAAAERRLALCALRHDRLGETAPQLSAFARSETGRRIVEMVARQVVAFDYEQERVKFRDYGPTAAEARAQFVPPTSCSPWRSSNGCVPSECKARCHVDAHCLSCLRIGLFSGKERAQAVAFLLEGHPQQAFDGVYKSVLEHNGFPMFRNSNGMYCMRSETTHGLFLSDQLDPYADCMTAMLPMSEHEGPIPTDDLTHETCWLCVDAHDPEGSWISRPFRFKLLMTEADVMANSPQVGTGSDSPGSSLVVSGCPVALSHCNGQYAPCKQPPLCSGWTHYQSSTGCRLYFCEMLGRWFINAHFTPDLDGAYMWIDPTHVPFSPKKRLPVDVPLGVRTWQCDEGELGQPKWMARTISVRKF